MRRILNLSLLFLIIAIFKVLGVIFSLFARKIPPNQHLDDTLRLYRRGPGGTEFAWFYEIGDRLYIDRGNLGDMADPRDVPLEDWPEVEAEMKGLKDAGFAELDEDDWQLAQIVYEVPDNAVMRKNIVADSRAAAGTVMTHAAIMVMK